MTIATTMVGLYLGASDTLTNTLRWLMLILAENDDVQQNCYNELMKSIDDHGVISKDHCPYISDGFTDRP